MTNKVEQMNNELLDDMDKMYALQADGDALLILIREARSSDAAYLSAIKEISALKDERDALQREMEGLREGALQAHKLLGALRGIDMHNATVRDSVGAAYVHLSAAIDAAGGETK